MTKHRKPCLFDGDKSSEHMRRTCLKCKLVYQRRWRKTEHGAKYESIRNKSMNGTTQAKAKSQIYMAVRAGKIPPAAKLKCKDCKKQAEVYDHRNYQQPHKVSPVCRSCNSKRGPAKFANQIILL